MATKAEATPDTPQANEPTAPVDSGSKSNIKALPTTDYFVPDYGVSVKAVSLDDAVKKAKQLKGVK